MGRGSSSGQVQSRTFVQLLYNNSNLLYSRKANQTVVSKVNKSTAKLTEKTCFSLDHTFLFTSLSSPHLLPIMPYIDHSMATSMGDSQTTLTSDKVVRTVPHFSVNQSSTSATTLTTSTSSSSKDKSSSSVSKASSSASASGGGESKYAQDFSVKRLVYMRNLLKAEVKINLTHFQNLLNLFLQTPADPSNKPK